MRGRGTRRRTQGNGLRRLIFVGLLLLMVLPSPLIAEARHALVIGNGDYEEMGALKNPVNDAIDMAGALANLGFEVQTLIDADVVSMEEAIVRFGQRLSRSVDSVGFFFYAGHGVQSNGSNYLIPARAKIESEAFLRSHSVSVQAVLDTMQAAGNRLNIMVLDACRENPFLWARSGQRGLSIVAYQPPGSIIVYAASVGGAAVDGDGRNGIFTGELLRELAIQDMNVAELFRLTREAVRERSAGRQIPAIFSQYYGKDTLLLSSDAAVGAVVSAPVAPQGQTPLAMQTGKADLFITTDPPGADIIIDGNVMGKAPVFLDDVTAGTLLAIEARQGTMSAQEMYRIAEGFNELPLTLGQERGTLFIQTSASDAELYIDGMRVGLVGNGLVRDVEAGHRTVEIRASGGTSVHEVVIAKDETITLEPEFGWLRYMVRFDASGGSLSGSASKQLRYREAYGNLPVPKRSGYVFNGWWTSPGKGGYQVQPTTTYTLSQDQTLYAAWSPNTYTVRFDSRGGSGHGMSSKSVVNGQMYGFLPTPVKDGYAFGGWWTDPIGPGWRIQDQTIVDIAANQTLYARWSVAVVGKMGPAGGYIFYDKGSYSDGWRYLEAAPAEWSGGSSEPRYVFGYVRTTAQGANMEMGTSTQLGKGKSNTAALVNAMGNQAYSSESGGGKAMYAAKVASDYNTTVDGVTYNDWFLPSRDELDLMYRNLRQMNLGGFSGNNYWSSSERGGGDAYIHSFASGSRSSDHRFRTYRVRPIRSF